MRIACTLASLPPSNSKNPIDFTGLIEHGAHSCCVIIMAMYDDFTSQALQPVLKGS